MPTMILVEDEGFERSSLVNCVNWSLAGIQIIGEAANGSLGFSLVEKLQPDIVLTDVKMPIMDGIELSKKIRRHAPETKIIFLSSYDDFEYAKQAIDLNILAYVMKPVNEIELLRVVKKASDAVVEKALEKHMYNETQKKYMLYTELLQRTAEHSDVPILPEKKKNKKQIADEVEKIILSRYQEVLTLESIAKQLNFTPNYLGTVFKSVKKYSVNRFLMKTRIDKAKDLLKTSNLTINDVAEQCGFSSLPYFHTTFKNETSLTPGDFRRGSLS